MLLDVVYLCGYYYYIIIKVFKIVYLKQTMFLGYIYCCSCVFTICVTCNVISHVYFHISTFRSICAVPNMAVFCSSFVVVIIIIISNIIIIIIIILRCTVHEVPRGHLSD